MSMRLKTGFTIVELLIVIVVIAILAAISIIAYNGIQQRSQNTQTQNVVKSYYKALVAYAVDHGAYPAETGQWCLGEGYTCAGLGATPNQAVNDAIRPYFNNANPLPAPSRVAIFYSSGNRIGAGYHYMSSATLDGENYPWGLNYILQGNVECGLDHIAGTNPHWPSFTSTPNATGATEQQSNNTYCRMILPNPAKL